MNATRIALSVTLALGLHGGAVALDAAQADRLVKDYLKKQQTADMSSDVQQQVIADLNGDGQSEIVLLWSLLGPTYWYTHVSVLAPAGKGYGAAKADITGMAETLRVERGSIVVDTKVLGKNDARCCPSLKKVVRFKWDGKKLVPA